MHNQSTIPASTVFYGIDKELRNIISARRVRKRFSDLMVMWLRSVLVGYKFSAPSCILLFFAKMVQKLRSSLVESFIHLYDIYNLAKKKKKKFL